jgi:hypothetical protein
VCVVARQERQREKSVVERDKKDREKKRDCVCELVCRGERKER